MIPTLADIRPPPTALQRVSAWARWPALALCLLFAAIAVRQWRGSGKAPMPALALLAVSALACLFLVHQERSSRLDSVRLQQLVGDLLHNVYRAFDYRGEEVIYDVLARSAAGDLLTEIYLETRRGLELANQGGARVKVKDIEVLDTRLLEDESGTLTVDSRWNVSGSVGHWGHVHQRRNGYHAMLSITEIDGAWKLTGLEILQEERL